MQQVDGVKVCFFGCFVCGVLEYYGNGMGENGQYLFGGGYWQSNGDIGGNVLVVYNYQNGGDNVGQC